MKKNKPRILLCGLVSLLFFNFGCIPLGYYHSLAKHQAFLLRSARPITDVLNDPNTKTEIKDKLQLVLKVREFASTELGLNVGSNYLNYVPLKEDAVTFVVHAAEAFSLTPYHWSYPIVGKLPYKGFPTRNEAKAEVTLMEQQGYDVFARGVSAYSSLGWFDDPVFSSMLNLPAHRLVETIIHESVHATVFFKDDADFNERLATFLGTEGAKLFYRSASSAKEDEQLKIEDEKQDQNLFSAFITRELADLKAWYKSLNEEFGDEVNLEKRKHLKQQKLKSLQEKFKRELMPRLKTDSYSKFADLKLNNAILLMFSTYSAKHEDLDRLYKTRSSFKDFIAYLSDLNSSDDIAWPKDAEPAI